MRLRSLMSLFTLIFVLSACSSTPASTPSSSAPAPSAAADTSPIIMAWYPNESGSELGAARDALAAVVSEALKRPVQHQTTTDYIIAIEAMANNNAHLAFFGAEGYVQAHDKNPKVLPLVLPSGTDGTLNGAVYYSWLAVMRGQEGNYQENGAFKLDNIQGQRFSFVSNSSTSGFRVPSANILNYFSAQEKWKDLTSDDLIEGGADNFFSEVQFGGSHQGSAVNLISGKVDVAAFCDTCVENYVTLVEGTANTAGAVYRVNEKADEPFTQYAGAEFVIISATPVLNAPFVVNTTMLTEAEIQTLKDALTSDAVAQNTQIFAPKEVVEAGYKPLFRKTKDERFVLVEDAFFDPIRALR
ncbi:PhnD/SsuA/transferrin family substrate-binding protein [Candidatus Oscillochloris fontis]|uniref:PhnD/SsuA/transferrin family substrate-binding protein n=1 Tax=Candidatus Oscillochloris fontis TaxID=2496868 RepID=UPI00101E1D4D|nr:PhnD/SsuA/transferrin family substrate-binding protein [Candidatus Oscillochloris fontis]